MTRFVWAGFVWARFVRGLGWSLALTLIFTGCHSAASTMRPGPSEPDSPIGSLAEPALSSHAALWQLGKAHWPGQRTLRLSYDDGGGDVTLYVVWRIESPQRYSLLAKDRLGRSWWSLAVDGSEAVAVELRKGTYCRYRGEVELEVLPLGPLDFGVLPLLLVGQAPLRPTRLLQAQEPGELRLLDRVGQEWRLVLNSATNTIASSPAVEVRAWTVFADGRPATWYDRRGDVHRLSSRGVGAGERESAGIQLRWKLGKVQPATQAPLAVAPPVDSMPGDCGSADRMN